MLDIVENITLDSINETANQYLNLDNLVDSRWRLSNNERFSVRRIW